MGETAGFLGFAAVDSLRAGGDASVGACGCAGQIDMNAVTAMQEVAIRRARRRLVRLDRDDGGMHSLGELQQRRSTHGSAPASDGAPGDMVRLAGAKGRGIAAPLGAADGPGR